MPCANFPDELIAAYPDAKVILTTRDPDKWIASVESSFYRIIDSPTWKIVPYILPVCISFDTISSSSTPLFYYPIKKCIAIDSHIDQYSSSKKGRFS
jgi:hypothetical protein